MSNCFKKQILKETVNNLPSLPGVYRFLDEKRQVLYVGKARNIKKRVSSYFNKNIDSPRIALMVSKISFLDITVTRSENEALLLESNLIKALAPRYNILFRDDKTYPYLKLSAHCFPRMVYYRGKADQENRYFGPFPSTWAVRESINILQTVFKLRICEDSVFHHRTRPCLLHSIGRCSAPCTGEISERDYSIHVDSAVNFLSGKHLQLIQDLERKMLCYSQDLSFEKAAIIRNQLAALSRILEKQSVDIIDQSDVDIIAVAILDTKVCVTLAMVRGGRHLGDKAYFPQHLDSAILFDRTSEVKDLGQEDNRDGSASSTNNLHADVLKAFLMQHYFQSEIPSTLVLSHPLSSKDFEKFLSEQHGKKINIVCRPQGQRKVWLTMAKHNADLSLSNLMSQAINSRESALDLIKLFNLKVNCPEDLHVDCFDVSHTSGEATQAACVVYRGGVMRKSDYRRYNIKGLNPGDDYGAMREAIMRHYKIKEFDSEFSASVGGTKIKTVTKNFSDTSDCLEAIKDTPHLLPDLVLVDGGKGQVEVARQIFQSRGYNISSIVGVAKGEGRKVGLETLIFADCRDSMVLGKASRALMLIAHIRDEAHRFAITGMRASRQKIRGRSLLEEIDGIGQKRRQRLLARFGGLRGVEQASVDELASVEGISKKIAENIYQQLH